MSKEDNLAVQSIGGEIAATRDFERFSELFAEDVIDHDAGQDQARGVEGVIQYWRALDASFPDFTLDVDILIGEDDFVTLGYRLSGTHEGEFMGYAPTGRHFDVRSLQVGRFENGKIAERWGSTDIFGILTQLGLVASEKELSTNKITTSVPK
jgi:steroid delta-isomerase-like uncharacterized protein